VLILGQETVDLTATVFTEAFYFFTVAIMWLLHVGFMTYEAGVSRRKNVMATAIKNILTIAVVTPVFYYVGWWIYFCMEEGLIPTTTADGNNPADTAYYFCGSGYAVPWEGNLGPNLGDNISGVFWAAFVLFSWTTGSIMSGAIRTSAYLWLTAFLGGIVWVVAAAWGWSFGGWLTIHFGYHDFAASGVVHGVAGIFTLGVLFNLGPRLGRYDREGGTRTFRPHNLHMTLQGHFHGVLRFLRRMSGDHSGQRSGLGEHLLQPRNVVGDHVHDHDRFRGRFRRRLLLLETRSVLDDFGRFGRCRRCVSWCRHLRTVARVHPGVLLGRLCLLRW